MDDVWIVVPVGKREKYLLNLLKKIHKYNGRIIFINNHKPYSKYYGVIHLEDFDEVNIYRWWNKGIDYAKEHGAKYVAILNDDLDFDENFIDYLFKFISNNNYYIVDISNAGNNGGAAWMLDVSSELRLNEEFRWWYGDTFIFEQAKKINKFARTSYNNFKHLEPNKQTNDNIEIKMLIGKDEKKYRELVSKI